MPLATAAASKQEAAVPYVDMAIVVRRNSKRKRIAGGLAKDDGGAALALRGGRDDEEGMERQAGRRIERRQAME